MQLIVNTFGFISLIANHTVLKCLPNNHGKNNGHVKVGTHLTMWMIVEWLTTDFFFIFLLNHFKIFTQIGEYSRFISRHKFEVWAESCTFVCPHDQTSSFGSRFCLIMLSVGKTWCEYSCYWSIRVHEYSLSLMFVCHQLKRGTNSYSGRPSVSILVGCRCWCGWRTYNVSIRVMTTDLFIHIM